MQERANGEIGCRSRVVQVFPSAASPERLARAVMCDMDEEWQDARYFSKRKMDEPHDESRAAGGGEATDAGEAQRVAPGGEEGD